MGAIETLARILGISFVSGINLYATVLVVGLSIREGWVSGLPPELGILAHSGILLAAGFLYIVEFGADKIPLISTLWDIIHTFVRPLGGAILAVASSTDLDPSLRIVAFMVGGSVALGTHSTKAGLRILAHRYPHPVAQSTLSILEDFSVVGLLVLVYTHQLAALSVLVALLILIVFLAPILFRTVVFGLRGAAGRIIFWKRGHTLPVWLDRQIGALGGSMGVRTCLCFARDVQKVPKMKKGYLLWRQDELLFAHRHFFRSRVVVLGANGKNATDLSRGLVFDVLEVVGNTGTRQTFYLTKDHSRALAAAGTR